MPKTIQRASTMALLDRETITFASRARPRSNGNATQDANRNIGTNGIAYSVHNLVQQVTITGGATLTYTYDGAGAKLRMANSNGAVNTKYAGAFEYNQANYLTRVATEEGQITVTNNGNDFAFEYYLQDPGSPGQYAVSNERSRHAHPGNRIFPFWAGYF